MDYQALAELLFPNVTDTPETLEERFPLRNLPEGAVVTRMAPSPTGFVHLGNLVQGLTSERMAHQSGGVLFLRVEDTDAKREVPGAVEVLINSLKHYSINFDEGATIEEAAAYAGELIPKLAHWFTVEDLVYLKRGGRVSPAVALVGGMLIATALGIFVYPSLYYLVGRVAQFEKRRERLHKKRIEDEKENTL